MSEIEGLQLALLNLTKTAADKKINHWTVVDALHELRASGVPEHILPSIDYMIPPELSEGNQ